MSPGSKYFVGALVAALVLSTVGWFVEAGSTPPVLATYLIAVFLTIFGTYRLAKHLGSAAEHSIDDWSDLSYISLTAGDKKLISETEKRNSNTLWIAGIKIFVSTLIPVAARLGIMWLLNK